MVTTWLDDEQLNVWVRLKAVMELLPSALDSELRRAAELTYFEYYVLAMLSEADGRVLRMSALAARTNATLPRLSHVVRKMAERGLVRRTPDPQDGRSVLVHLTEEGYAVLVAAAPGHVDAVRRYVFDRLDDEQVSQLGAIADAMLDRLDPEGVLTHEYRRPADPGRPAG
ncbi:MarR family winged helix-turn-helix transcriptional regulator [Ornithinimicrobium tianjinense]|uniref:MarR family transcriptional regulator n=1 Tax=Ornithinimicrobium tianjinense TaxID=1195761 RepID=A0A917BV04_9MICO|nr:MarR family transcriptional regulator [Ornithinimicrobium tianjinense]GGF57828.1 MarR family transcriptional regulator [Ornithinimicrobium tianjinense]